MASVQEKAQHHATKKRREETPGAWFTPPYGSGFSNSVTHTHQREENVITNIRITSVAFGLGQVPARFYIVVHHDDREWRTETKKLPENDDTVEWTGPIPLPSDPSATVSIAVYISLESEHKMGAREQSRKLSVTVEQLLDRSLKGAPFTLIPNDGDLASSCLSVLVDVDERHGCENSGSSAKRVLDFHNPTEPEDAADPARNSSSRFRKHEGKRDLVRSVQDFERASSISPLDSALLESLYHHTLTTRPVGHVDQCSTISCMATVTFTPSMQKLDKFEEALPGIMLHEAKGVGSTECHQEQIVTSTLQVDAGHRTASVQAASHLTDRELLALSVQLLGHVQRNHDLVKVQQTITVLEKLIGSTPALHELHRAGLANLGVALDYRFKRLGELDDLEEATSRFRDAVNLTPHDHFYKPIGLDNLGNCFMARFKRLGKLYDLEDAISMFGNAVDLAPHGHPDKPDCLDNLSDAFKARFERLGNLGDLENAISALKHVVDLTPRDHPALVRRLGNLGNAFTAHFEHSGELSDLEDAISTLRNVVDLTPRGPNKAVRLNNLGNSLFDRFKRLGKLNDLDDAISRYREAVDVAHGDLHKLSHLTNLGNSLRNRFERLGDLADIEEAILTQRKAVDLTSHGHPDLPGRLNNLGNCFTVRFERLGDLCDLQDAILSYQNAVRLTPHGHPQEPCYLGNLGTSLRIRFGRLGEPSDLEDAILRHRETVNLTPPGHPARPGRLNSLGSSLRTRFERLGGLSDLGEAITILRDAVELSPFGHPDKPGHLNNLSNCLLSRYERLGDLTDLDGAISTLRDTVDHIPDSHVDKATLLNTLGNSFEARFGRLGELSDLEIATSTLRDVVNLTPHGHPDKHGRLTNLGRCLMTRYECLGSLSDLEEAISMHRDAVSLTPNDHPHKPTCLSGFGSSLLTRFECLGELCDLDGAISGYKGAVELTPSGHPQKPHRLNNLGGSLLSRFARLGELSDLESAISMLRDAVDLIPDDHTDKATLLNTLGNCIAARFQHLGERSDLEFAISTFLNAVNLTPAGHPSKNGRLSNLGDLLRVRYECLGELSDIEDAISVHRDAVNLTSHDHPLKPTRLSKFGSAFFSRFNRLGELRDLEDAISIHREAVDLTPRGDSRKSGCLRSLGNCLITRYEHYGEMSDLETAMSTFRHVIDLTPHGHPLMPSRLGDLGHCLVSRFERLGDASDLERAISLYSDAASAVTGRIRDRFQASREWISCARRISHHSLLDAYSVAVSYLPALAWIGLSFVERYGKLMQGAEVVQEAAAAALDAGFPETAAEWLEKGRSIVWGELLQLRNSYEELESAHPDHAQRLQEYSAALEHASATHERSLSAVSERAPSSAHITTESVQQEADKHRMLAMKRDELLKEIRGLPGFERFLLHKEYSKLRAAARFGPVVILNATESRCDALIVLADTDHVVHVPLPNFTFKRTSDLQNTLKSFVRHSRAMRSGEREGQSITLDGVSWDSLLSPLWKCVVKPVLDALDFSTPGELRRIFWCPTGPFTFLPIHAAGLYDSQYSQPGHKVFDFVISSYVPTLSALMLPANPFETSSDIRFLTVRQPSSDGLSRLPGVATELAHIKEVIGNTPSPCTSLMESSDGTIEEVLTLMKDADWVHFACHGIQDDVNSGLCLADGRRLKLCDIVSLSRPHGGLAFLSACQTATGDESLSDEAVHIAAGMLFAGFGGVVGTMWSISDKLAPDVARDVYEQLFRNGTKPDYRDAARALHEAVGRIREGGNVSFEDWLPFIHVGL